MHGGSQPRGQDSPNTVHGLRSQYLDDDDQEIYEQVKEQPNAELVQEEIWFIKTKLLRAAKESGGNSAESLVRQLIEGIDENQSVDKDLVGALSQLLSTSDSAVDRALGRLNDLIRTHHKITEGDTVNVNHSGQIDGDKTIEFSEEERELGYAALRARREADSDE